ncbi:PD-(D/E)XK nuclease-like domain-containing protein [Algimonas porphyrae]|uniref:PD-(D/E)XK nuclease-like domain-containing protein n=1 Tax=Algimonas porphyrae TaxID=1128113 RepID=UPI0024E0F61F|nr:PD-(D/E)XK nuclease-like domain-containing protein [Algimonas porphyrae]
MIDKPGVYDIDMGTYHSDCAWLPSLSSGDLVAISKNPAKWYAYHWSNPKRFKRPETDALRIGKAAHALVTGGEDFKEHYAIRPARFTDWKTKASKAWRDKREGDGITVITIEQMRLIKGMARALKSSPEAMQIFEVGRPEQSLFWESQGVVLKARPDVIPIQDARIICDYKTVASVEPRKLMRAILDFGWAQKLANVTAGMIATVPTGAAGFEDFDFVLICQEKSPPFEVVCVTIPHTHIADLMRLNEAAVAEFIKSREDGFWRGANDGFVEYHDEEWKLASMASRYGGLNGLPGYKDHFRKDAA